MASKLGNYLDQTAAGETSLSFDPTGKSEQHLDWISLDRIELDGSQPRKDPGDLSELSASIKEHGLINPIIVEPIDQKRYRVLSGERRYRAAWEAGLTKVRCIIRTVEDHERIALQLIENIHRKDLNPVEEAQSFKQLMVNHNIGQEQLAERLNKSLGSINQTLRILDLPQDVLSEVPNSEKATKSLLLEIAKQKDEAKQRELWTQVKDGTLSVRRARSSKSASSTSESKGQTKKKEAFSTEHDATVIVQSKTEELSWGRVVSALREALERAEQSNNDDQV